MSTTISQSKLFRVTVSINDEMLKAMRNAPELAQRALLAGADYWHTGILPKHFKKDAHDVYGYAIRARTYRRQKRGMPDLIKTGSLARDLKARAAFVSGSKGEVTLKMSARVLNFVPRMADNDQDLYVKHNKPNHRGYPNLKRELKVVTDADREAIAVVIAATLEQLFGNTEGRESDD